MKGNVVVREEEEESLLSMLLVSIITDHQAAWAGKTFLENWAALKAGTSKKRKDTNDNSISCLSQ